MMLSNPEDFGSQTPELFNAMYSIQAGGHEQEPPYV